MLLSLTCSTGPDAYRNRLCIDPADIPDSLLPVVLQENGEKIAGFEKRLSEKEIDSGGFEGYYDLLFRYRDTALLPVYIRIIGNRTVHPYFRAQALYAAGETGGHGTFDTLASFWKTERNSLTREYLAGALEKTADSTRLPALAAMLRHEKNAYIRKTLEAAIGRASGGRRAKIAYLPLCDTMLFRRLKTFPSESGALEFSLIARRKIDSGIDGYIPVAATFMFPHQQYKLCRSVYEKVRQPFASFGLSGVNHVGEDIDVYLGKIVRVGDKIGEIGPSFTFQNGGYRAHLHLGIEKAPIERALIAGYSDSVGRWYNPVDFIGKK